MATSYGWGSNEPTIAPAAQGGDSVYSYATKVKTVVADVMTKLNAEWWNTGGTCAVNITGNAGTATKLATARTIAISGGATGMATGFDGSGNISIPVTSLDASVLTGTASVNTTGSAAKLTTARTISLSGGASGSVSFDGSSDVSLSVTSLDASKLTGTASVNTTGNAATATTAASCTGNAATATTAASCTGNAATATKLKSYVTIGNVLFNGTDNINPDYAQRPTGSRVASATGTSYTAPSGGHWLVWFISFYNNALYSGGIKVVAGGTTVTEVHGYNSMWWAWEINYA